MNFWSYKCHCAGGAVLVLDRIRKYILYILGCVFDVVLKHMYWQTHVCVIYHEFIVMIIVPIYPSNPKCSLCSHPSHTYISLLPCENHPDIQQNHNFYVFSQFYNNHNYFSCALTYMSSNSVFKIFSSNLCGILNLYFHVLSIRTFFIFYWLSLLACFVLPILIDISSCSYPVLLRTCFCFGLTDEFSTMCEKIVHKGSSLSFGASQFMWLPLTLYPAMPHNLRFIYNTQFRETGHVLLKSIFFKIMTP